MSVRKKRLTGKLSNSLNITNPLLDQSLANISPCPAVDSLEKNLIMSDVAQQQQVQTGNHHRTYDGPDPRQMLPPRAEGYRPAAIRESRIKDRPYKPAGESNAMSIKIELDLEVEVDLYARVKGDVVIGLL
ncbi:hypothetical protein BDZ45DRAFT_650611 [Acephala macrosclerotiorum]|nr:hypothetical protein BDZ45DRAFT_650611 [Acephala macrosclerotiorum]